MLLLLANKYVVLFMIVAWGDKHLRRGGNKWDFLGGDYKVVRDKSRIYSKIGTIIYSTTWFSYVSSQHELIRRTVTLNIVLRQRPFTFVFNSCGIMSELQRTTWTADRMLTSVNVKMRFELTSFGELLATFRTLMRFLTSVNS